MAGQRPNTRQRGNIAERSGALRVRLYAGLDPMTGKQSCLRATIDGTDGKAWRRAEDKLAEFRTEVLKRRTASSSVALSYVLDEWMKVVELAQDLRRLHRADIRPTLGAVAPKKLDARMMESLYTELRRCRARCDGKPHIERHKGTEDGHDCKAAGCTAHQCRPMAVSTVRQIHGIISEALGAAVR
jgi:integrase